MTNSLLKVKKIYFSQNFVKKIKKIYKIKKLASDVDRILNWKETQHLDVEIPFKPARVLLQDFT